MSLKDSCRFIRKSYCQGIILLCTDVRKDMELPVLFPMACIALDLKRDYCIIRHSLRCLRHLGVSFTGGTPFALSLNALRLPHAARSHSVSPYTTSHAKHYCSTRRAVLVHTIHHYCSPHRSVVVMPYLRSQMHTDLSQKHSPNETTHPSCNKKALSLARHWACQGEGIRRVS